MQLSHKGNITPKLNTLKEKESFTEMFGVCYLQKIKKPKQY